MLPSPDPRPGPAHPLAAALARRRDRRLRSPDPIVLPLAGGTGALLPRSSTRRLVSVVDGGETVAAGGLARLLARLQARRSRLLLVRDRADGMRLAGAWRVDLSRIRLVEPGADCREAALRHLAALPDATDRPWHAG